MAAPINFAAGVQPAQIESPLVQTGRALEIQAATQRNQLAQMQMAEMQRGMEQKVRMRNLLANTTDATAPQVNKLLEQAYIQEGDIAGLMAHRKTQAEAEAAAAKVAESRAKTSQAEQATKSGEFKLQQDKLKHGWETVSNATTPEEYRLAVQDAVSKGYFDQATADRELSQVPVDEAQYKAFRQDRLLKLLDAKDRVAFTAPKYEYKDVGGSLKRVQVNPNAPGFNLEESELTKTLSKKEQADIAHQKVTERQAAERLQLDKEKVAREADPVFRQQMANAETLGKKIAENDVQALAALPKILDTAEMGINTIDQMIGKQEVRDKNGKIIQAGTAPHSGFQLAVGASALPGSRFIPGSPAANFQALYDQVMGGAFLEAYESLRGANAITNIEGEKGTAAKTRLSLAQSEDEFIAAARELQDIMRKGTERARQKAKGINPAAASSGDAAKLEEILKKY